MSKMRYPLNLNVSRIVWIDMEMTGLEPETCHILEVACIITDADLNIIAEGPDIVIHQPKHILDGMNEWCLTHHSASGLTKESLASNISLEDAENELLNFFSKHIPEGKCPLAGSSIYMDKMFMMKYFPRLSNYLHYHLIDVSSIKELCWRWFPKIEKMCPKKTWKHRALHDIKESIEELKYYRQKIFINPPGANQKSKLTIV